MHARQGPGPVRAGARVVCLDRRKRADRRRSRRASTLRRRAASVPDWLALVGDSADGFPGLAGWGAKAASAVLGRYGSIEAIPPARVGLEGGPACSPGGQPGRDARKGLRAGDAFQEAGDLRREAGDPPSRGAPPSTAWPGGDRNAGFARMCDRLEAPSPACERTQASVRRRGPQPCRATAEVRSTAAPSRSW